MRGLVPKWRLYLWLCLGYAPRTLMCTSLSANWRSIVWALAADAELLYQCQVALAIVGSDVAQQTAALAYHLQKPAASHKVMLVDL